MESIMKIIIVGCGNVGTTLTEQLSNEGHDVTVIDSRSDVVENVSSTYDVLGVIGNATSVNIQMEAGVNNADLLVAVTGLDEMNLLCCLIAKRAGAKHIIARVSNPIYNKEVSFFKEELGLSMVINPQFAAAREMVDLLKFPSALELDVFPKSRVELVNFKLEEKNPLCGKQLSELGGLFQGNILIPVVERGDEVIVPSGNFQLEEKDIVTFLGTTEHIVEFFNKVKIPTAAAKDVLIVGGGRTTIYLAYQLIDMGVNVKIVEKDEERCEFLSELLPKAMIIHGDATDKDLLIEEGITEMEAFVANTNIDEENIMLSLYAKSMMQGKTITKVHRISYDEIIDKLDLGSIVYPKFTTAERIIKYVRGMESSIGSSNIETLYKLSDNRVEALELSINEDSPVIGKPLKEIRWKPGVIIGCINHKGVSFIANGKSVIEKGDTVILITTTTGMHDIDNAIR